MTDRHRNQYYWWDPESGAALYHTEAFDDEADIFFDTVEEAEQFLERRAEAGDEERYEDMILYRQGKVGREMEAVEVLMEQTGMGDFL